MPDLTRDEIEGLASRVEAASGPDRELDCRIWLMIRGIRLRKFMSHPNKDGRLAAEATRFARTDQGDISVMASPPYSRSLDAALSLVPEGWQWRVGTEGYVAGSYAVLTNIQTRAECRCDHAASPALSLTAAALRALASQVDHAR